MIALSESADLISPKQYLEREINSPIKHEYIAGQVLAMAGTTDSHTQPDRRKFVCPHPEPHPRDRLPFVFG